MPRGRILIFGFWVVGAIYFLGSPATAGAEEVAIRYQVVDRADGLDSSTWTVKLELSNHAGEELHNLSISLFISVAQTGFDEPAVSVGTLDPTSPQVVIATFVISHDDLALLGDAPIRFLLRYVTAGGIPRSAVIQGQAGPSSEE